MRLYCSTSLEHRDELPLASSFCSIDISTRDFARMDYSFSNVMQAEKSLRAVGSRRHGQYAGRKASRINIGGPVENGSICLTNIAGDAVNIIASANVGQPQEIRDMTFLFHNTSTPNTPAVSLICSKVPPHSSQHPPPPPSALPPRRPRQSCARSPTAHSATVSSPRASPGSCPAPPPAP